MSYSVKNVKTFRGNEGTGFNATLYRDNKKVALVDDDAWGGCYSWDWLDYDQPKVEVTFKNHKGEDYTIKVTPEHAAYIEFLKAQGKDGEFEFEDSYAGELVNKFLEMRDYKRWCKKQTVFRLKGDKPGEWRTLGLLFSDPRAKKYLADKYGAQVEEILNERIA